MDKFYIKSGSQNFKLRQNDLFSALATYEANVQLPQNITSPPQADNETQRHEIKKNRKATRALRGQESLFKLPGSPPLKPRMPDFKRNPQRWTKYTLADVSSEDTSDRGNTAAAMDFLRSRQLQNTKPDDTTQTIIKFNKSFRSTRSNINRDDEEDGDNSVKIRKSPVCKRTAFGEDTSPVEEVVADRPVFIRNKLVMPEYVVGDKVAKPKKSRPATQLTGKGLTLSHLINEDD